MNVAHYKFAEDEPTISFEWKGKLYKHRIDEPYLLLLQAKDSIEEINPIDKSQSVWRPPTIKEVYDKTSELWMKTLGWPRLPNRAVSCLIDELANQIVLFKKKSSVNTNYHLSDSNQSP